MALARMNHEGGLGHRSWTRREVLRAGAGAAALAAVGEGRARGADDGPADVIVRGGRVIDGTGAPWYAADLAIVDGRIRAIMRAGGVGHKAARVVDAAGLHVAPGFIDMMGQTGAPFLESPRAADNLLFQGITTINAGEGDSDAPLDGPAAARAGWRTMAEFFGRLARAGMPMNVVQTIGHTRVRQLVIGDVDRPPTPAELDRMKGLVREAMSAGAIGVSTALIYPPAVYADTAEIAALARVAGEFGGGYFTHMRNEGDRLLEAIDEALAIGEAAGTPVHIFHLKAAGKANWPKMDLALARIKAARAAGRAVGADIYPYINNGLGIASFIHPRHSSAGRAALLTKLADPAGRAEIRREMESEAGWENWYRHIGSEWDNVVLGQIKAPAYAGASGRSLAEIARHAGKDPWEVFFEIAAAGAGALPRSMSEANVIKAMRQEFISFCTDMGPAGSAEALVHPRGAGAFPRIMGRYVRELGVLSLEQAVARMTAVAANELTLYDRGRIAPGAAADLVVFDADAIADRSTFAAPGTTASGVVHLLVNGVPVIEGGKTTDALPGRVLRRAGHRES
jgi:N-acyl-D-aspartate/D-glutamate deacylase